MFVLTLLADTIRVPPHLLSVPTLTAVASIIEGRYPNRVVVDVGLVVCPYGPPLEVGDGVLAPGDGGSHHQCVFRCLVFRPFVEEVLVGVVTGSHGGGVTVSVGGFFDRVFIPAYWMLNPSRYDEGVGLWVWTPNYEDDAKEEGGDGEEEVGGADGGGGGGRGENGSVKREEGEDDVDGGGEDDDGAADGWIEEEEEGGGTAAADEAGAAEEGGGTTTANRFEILIGSAIRFKVKAVNFTRITTTMKGVQATTTTTTTTTATTSHASSSSASSDRAYGLNGSGPSPDDGNGGGSDPDGGGGGGAVVRRRSSSADLSDAASRPAPMQIVGSICEDGLGLISWWDSPGEEESGGEHDEDGEAVVDCGDDDGGGWDANGVKMEEEVDWMKVEEEN